MMRQDEDGGVIRRFLAPPLPALVRPRASDRAEHVAPQDPGADSGKALLRNRVIDPRLSIALAERLPKYAGGEEPCLSSAWVSDIFRFI